MSHEYYVIYSMRPYKKKLFSCIIAENMLEAHQRAMSETNGMFYKVLFKKEFDELRENFEMFQIPMSPTVYLVNVSSLSAGSST